MSAEALFLTGWAIVCLGFGVWNLLAAERITVTRRLRTQAGAAKYANRPAILRPKYANSRPTVNGTRLTGAGFCLLGLVGAVLAVRAVS